MFTKEISQIVIVLTKVQYSSEVDNFKEGVIWLADVYLVKSRAPFNIQRISSNNNAVILALSKTPSSLGFRDPLLKL